MRSLLVGEGFEKRRLKVSPKTLVASSSKALAVTIAMQEGAQEGGPPPRSDE